MQLLNWINKLIQFLHIGTFLNDFGFIGIVKISKSLWNNISNDDYRKNVDNSISYDNAIAQLDQQIAQLNAQIPQNTPQIIAEESGYFANVVDGDNHFRKSQLPFHYFFQ